MCFKPSETLDVNTLRTCVCLYNLIRMWCVYANANTHMYVQVLTCNSSYNNNDTIVTLTNIKYCAKVLKFKLTYLSSDYFFYIHTHQARHLNH